MLNDKRLEQRVPFMTTVLRGVAQIMLIENAWTGLLFLIGIFYGSPIMGLGALTGAMSGTFTAKILKYNQSEIEQGLYGFSAALVGVALTLFYKPVVWIWIAIIVGSIISAILQHLFIVYKFPAFTLPFVVVTWVFIYLLNHIEIFEPSTLLVKEYTIHSNYFTPLHGFGQVIFQGALLSGIIFVVAVFIDSPLAALFGIGGAIIAAILAMTLPVSTMSIAMGLWSYNAVLASIVFTGKKISDILWMVVVTVISVIIYYIMYIKGYLPLTFPFVGAAIFTLYLRKWINRLIFSSRETNN